METKLYKMPEPYENNIAKKEFYSNDKLNLLKYPDEIIASQFGKNHTRFLFIRHLDSELLRTQIKHYVEIVLQNRKQDILDCKETNQKVLNSRKKAVNANITFIKICIEYLEEIQPNSIFDLTEDELTTNFISFLEENDYGVNINKTKLKQMYNSLKQYYDTRVGLDKDIWVLNETFTIAEDRFNKSSTKDFTFDFTSIEDEANREIVKDFAKYCVNLTNISLGTINSRVGLIRTFEKWLKKSLLETTREDILNYYNYLVETEHKSLNSRITPLKAFFEWLSINEKIKECPVYMSDFVKTSKNFNTVDDYIVHQIFNVLDKIPEYFRFMFLISFSTGMRISEICLLKKDCLYKDKLGYFVKFFSQKMQKEVTNPISQTLYSLLDDYIKNLEDKSDYLFNAKRLENYPCNTEYFSTTFNKYMKEFNIKNVDGTPYRFCNHAFRHTIATKMVELDIPVQIIQKMLHHQSPEMTLAYAEMSEQHKIKKFKEFVNAKGELSPFKSFDDVPEELITAEWLRQNINAQALPNGYCGMPIKLGKCPHANSCLECDNFRTSIEFLEQHKNQLKKTNELIKICEENNWKPQLETNKKLKNILEHLIKRLESEKYE